MRGARRRVQGRAGRLTGPVRRLRLLPEQADDDGRGRRRHDARRGAWQLLRSLRNQGRDYDGGAWFNHVRLGFNYRWTDVQAAIGIAQLEKLDRILALRAEAAERYAAAARRRGRCEPLCADDDDHMRSWFVYVVALPHGVDRDRVMTELRAAGIGTADYVPCVHLQPYMRETLRLLGGHVPGRRGHRLADARAAVLPAARGRGPGAGRRGAAERALALWTNRHELGALAAHTCAPCAANVNAEGGGYATPPFLGGGSGRARA